MRCQVKNIDDEGEHERGERTDTISGLIGEAFVTVTKALREPRRREVTVLIGVAAVVATRNGAVLVVSLTDSDKTMPYQV